MKILRVETHIMNCKNPERDDVFELLNSAKIHFLSKMELFFEKK